MDWVHCNLCFKQPGDKEGRKFSITNCGHIYCSHCMESGKLEICHICRTSYTSIPLNREMKAEVEAYFLDPIDIIRKQTTVLEFQHNHRMRLVKYHKANEQRYDAVKEENTNLKIENRRLKEEVYIYKRKYAKLEKQYNHMSHSFSISPNYQDSPKENMTKAFQNLKESSAILHKNFVENLRGTQPEKSNDERILRRPNSNIFFGEKNSMSTMSDNKMFTPPFPPQNAVPYRYTKQIPSAESTPVGLTPCRSSSTTPDSSGRQIGIQRKVRLPGDKGGPSPNNRIDIRRLNLGTPISSSTPNIRTSTNVTNKYSKYF